MNVKCWLSSHDDWHNVNIIECRIEFIYQNKKSIITETKSID